MDAIVTPLDISAETSDAAGMRYPGGKNGSGTYQKIINMMPPHDRYFEPFLGSGAIMRLKRPALETFGLDLGASSLLAVSAELVRNGVAAGSIVIDDESRRRSPDLTMEYSGTASPKLADARIRYRLFRGCAIAFLDRTSTFTARDLVYCDPPYLMETRSGRRMYEHELTEISHRRLLRAIRKLPCMVMISGYWSSLYAEMLDGWNTASFDAMTRGGYQKTEHVWFNFPKPVELHDYSYLGEGFRERERIKRKKTRWVERLKRMPTLEKQSLLSAIAAIGQNAGSGEAGSTRHFQRCEQLL